VKVQVITSYSIKNSPPARNRAMQIVKSHLKLGSEVELISSDKSITSNDYEELRGYASFIHTSVKPVATVKRNFFMRAVIEIFFSFKAFYVTNKSNPDIKIITIPSMFLTLPLAFFSQKSIIVIDVRDLTWEYLTDTTYIKLLIKKIVRWLVFKGLVIGDVYTTTNKKELNYVKKLAPNSLSYQLSNGISISRYNDLTKLEKRKPSSKIKVAYIGTVGIAQNLITLLKAAQDRPQIEFKVVGEGIELDNLIKYCKLNQISNVDFFGSMDWLKILEVYDDVDILYANISSNYVTAVPSKIFEYIAAGKPVIFGCVGESRETLKDFRCVKAIEPDNVSRLVAALDSLVEPIDSKNVEFNRFFLKNNYIRENISEAVAFKLKNLVDARYS